MKPPAARVGDHHDCPQVSGTAPHVGGPLLGGAPNVTIGGLPAARALDPAVCVGVPDAVASGSTTVSIGGRPAARAGDPTLHGGTVSIGSRTVFIG